MNYNEEQLIKGWEAQDEACRTKDALKWFLAMFLCLMMLLGIASCAQAYTVDELATAIGKAENSKTHPYGILAHYKHTTPRQACINTIKHQYRLWVKSGQQGAFLTFLGASYAPIGASNDPKGLNKNWLPNVRRLLCLHYSKV